MIRVRKEWRHKIIIKGKGNNEKLIWEWNEINGFKFTEEL